MQKLLIVIAAAGSLGAAAIFVADVRSSRHEELRESLLAGVILGASVWPYGVGPMPDMRSTLLRSPDCDVASQCGGMYGLASATFAGRRPTGVDTD